MKKAYILLLAALLVLTGCGNKTSGKNVSEKDASCPYKIVHKNSALEITLREGEDTAYTWQTEIIPQDVCEVTQTDSKRRNTVAYAVNGVGEGAAELTVKALEDQTLVFELVAVVDVDAKGKVTLASCQHRERTQFAAEDNGLNYKWDVDVDGLFNFYFNDNTDFWWIYEDNGGVCELVHELKTPSGCEFSVAAKAPGQANIVLEGETTQRRIEITLLVDDEGKLELVSVQEQ